MTSTAISGSTAATSSATSQTAATKPSQQVDYMKLIVAQMTNLNPMDPSSGGDGMTTMMQAESLNQLTQLNQAIKDLQTMTQTGYASSLVGRTVSGIDEGGNPVSGTVTGMRMESTGPVLELSGGRKLKLLDITEVSAG